MNTICGAECSKCPFKEDCKGCAATEGKPFGGSCTVAECCKKRGLAACSECPSPCDLKSRLIDEFNSLGIADMKKVEDLNCLKGSYVNLEYPLPHGKAVKFLDDSRIYLGNQICKKDGNRCYGIVGCEDFLPVCEYGDLGADPRLILYKKR